MPLWMVNAACALGRSRQGQEEGDAEEKEPGTVHAAGGEGASYADAVPDSCRVSCRPLRVGTTVETASPGQASSRWTASIENAGRQMATYSAPPGSGEL